jgi:hypothetical protein
MKATFSAVSHLAVVLAGIASLTVLLATGTLSSAEALPLLGSVISLGLGSGAVMAANASSSPTAVVSAQAPVAAQAVPVAQGAPVSQS